MPPGGLFLLDGLTDGAILVKVTQISAIDICWNFCLRKQDRGCTWNRTFAFRFSGLLLYFFVGVVRTKFQHFQGLLLVALPDIETAWV